MKLPIRTNMGTDTPQGKLIGVRELYVYKNGDKYELWVGNESDGTAKELLVSQAYKADSLNSGNLINVQNGINNGIVAGLKVTVNTVDENGNTVDRVNIEPKETYSDVTLKSVNLDNIQKLVVSEENFGSDPNEVKNPKHGQLYFKI